MTVEASAVRAAYLGNGSNGPFPVPFRFLADDDLLVARLSVAGVETILTKGTDYSVTGVDTPSGGAIATTAAVAIGEKITIVPNAAIRQRTVYVPNDPFPAASHERALDRLTLIAQQASERLARAIRFRVSDGPIAELPGPTDRALKLVGFDNAGGIGVFSPSSLAKGDPGGNVMSIGTVAQAKLGTVPIGAEVVATSGDTTTADYLAGAMFVRDTGVTAAQIAANPFLGFVDAAGKVFRRTLGAFLSDDVSAYPRSMQSALMDRRSLLAHIPAQYHAAIRARTLSTAIDLGPFIRAAQAAVPAGATLYAPSGYYPFSTPVVWSKSIVLAGDPGREYYDNSWDATEGTVFAYYGDTGDAFTVRPVDVGNNRQKVVLRDFTVRGARVTRAGTATGGRGLVLDGRQQPGTALHINMRGVYVTEAKAEGMYLTGAIYGSTFIDTGAYRNGKNGRRQVSSGADAIGENVWIQFRAFENGSDGAANTNERAGVWDTPASSNNVYIGFSSTFNAGRAAVLQSSNYSGSNWQFESVSGPDGLYLGSEGGGLAVASCVVDGLMFSQDNYTGNFVNITSDAYNVQLRGVGFYGTLGVGGRDMFIAGPRAKITGLQPSTHTLVYQCVTQDAYVEDQAAGQNALHPRVRAALAVDQVNKTGDDFDYTVLWDNEITDPLGLFNAATGIFGPVPYKMSVRANATVTFANLIAGHDRVQLNFTCSDPAQSLNQPGPNPFVVKNANGSSPVSIAGIFDIPSGGTLKLVATVTGSTRTVTLKGISTHLAIEAL